MDPSKILFSVPTISDDLGPVEKVELPLPDSTFTLHEDDWCLVEFYSVARLPELKRMLTEYKAFEAKNRTSSGWKNVYVRRRAYTGHGRKWCSGAALIAAWYDRWGCTCAAFHHRTHRACCSRLLHGPWRQHSPVWLRNERRLTCDSCVCW